MTRVTVFGGTGFVGRRIVATLLAADFEVRIAARRPGGWAPDGEWGAQLQAMAVDVRSDASVEAALAGADAVVNAVSLYVERRDARFHGVHVEAAGRMAGLARERGIERYVHLSGLGVDPCSPSPYVRARAAGEAAVVAACPEAVILRPGAVVAAGEGLLATLDALTRLPVVPLFGRGAVRLQPVVVTDVAAAVSAVLGQPARGIFELGGADVLSYRQLIEAILACRGRRRLLLPVPMPVWHLLALAASPLPSPPLTRDQLLLLDRDNVVAEAVRGFQDLGIEPRGVLGLLRDGGEAAP